MAEFMNLHAQKQYKVRRKANWRDFKSLYRFQEENVNWMATYFSGENLERRGVALPSNHKMKVFLRYTANPGFQMGVATVAEELGITQSTVSKTISFVMNKIVEKSHLWIKFPSTQPKINEAQQAWQEKFQFPSAIGVIHCTHRLDFETESTRADVSWSGSVHDARIWRNCDIRVTMQQFPGAVLLDDDGYGLEPWLITLFRNPNNALERAYNRLFKNLL
ncbi:putative nuclease HARBI1 [Sitophilus oryzae]|uniref:Nuclease HARBI1 n=1 Tax=Sitophilus oryzae TaxID=7048 RepID=A0A6J2X6A6_SITOR|nr:putative nuclease HARBI1 [Sitophilus oryzae]